MKPLRYSRPEGSSKELSTRWATFPVRRSVGVWHCRICLCDVAYGERFHDGRQCGKAHVRCVQKRLQGKKGIQTIPFCAVKSSGTGLNLPI